MVLFWCSSIPFEERVVTVLRWLQLPEDERLVCIYDCELLFGGITMNYLSTIFVLNTILCFILTMLKYYLVQTSFCDWKLLKLSCISPFNVFFSLSDSVVSNIWSPLLKYNLFNLSQHVCKILHFWYCLI